MDNKAEAGSTRFKLLPLFAQYLLDHELINYIKAQLSIARELHLPMLRDVLQQPDELIIQGGIESNKEFLNYVVENRVEEFQMLSNKRWVEDQLEFAGKYDVVAEDITKGVFLRTLALKRFIGRFTTSVDEALALTEELDHLALLSLTPATQTLINLLKDRLNKEEYFSQHLLAASPGIIFIYDLDKEALTYINQNVERVLGYTSLALLKADNKIIEQFVHPDDIDALKRHRQLIRENQTFSSFQHEYRVKHADGHFLWVRSYEIVFSRNHEGRPQEIMVEMFEISKEKETAIFLQKREAQLLEAQEIAMIGSFEWNFRDHVLANSEQVREIFEYEEERPFTDFLQYVHPEDKKKVEQAFTSSLSTGHYECEYRYLIHNKQKYLWTRGIIDYDKGEPYKMVGTVQDISDRRKMEETLLQKTIELEKTNADLSEFTYVASHDLKEPLRKISVFADMIFNQEKDHLSETGTGYLQKIMESSGRMRQLIDDILTLSSVSSHPVKELVDLEGVLGEVTSLLDHTIRQKGAKVVSDGLPKVPMIPILAKQLFLNLISNSLKFSRPEERPFIEITHAWFDNSKILTNKMEKADYLQLIFKDNGIGFENEFADKIFQLFGRLHTKHEFEGTGLGLSICKRIVEEHGGTITASGAAGKGATFTVFLKVKE